MIETTLWKERASATADVISTDRAAQLCQPLALLNPSKGIQCHSSDNAGAPLGFHSCSCLRPRFNNSKTFHKAIPHKANSTTQRLAVRTLASAGKHFFDAHQKCRILVFMKVWGRECRTARVLCLSYLTVCNQVSNSSSIDGFSTCLIHYKVDL